MKGTQQRWKRRLAAALYVVALAAGAVAVSLGVALLGRAARRGHSVGAGDPNWILLAIALTSFAYAMREAGVWRLPVPSSPWQVPATWVRFGVFPSMALFGAAVGPGFLTRTPYPTYLVMLGWDAYLGMPSLGIVVGLLYATGRSLGVVIAAFAPTAEAVMNIPHRLVGLREAARGLTVGVLGTFSLYALVCWMLMFQSR